MSKSLSHKVLASCFLAGCLEIYDFTIFGFLASTIHKNYLSFLSETNALIVTYALFAVAFVFRPLGSIFFGYIGDKHGRKAALVSSVSMMGSAALLMAILPPYATIGIISCYFIAFIRIIQGFSIGGEYSGAIIYAIEHFDKKKAGFVGAIVISGCLVGAMLARLVSTIVQNPALPEYSWRFAFVLGFFLSLIGFFIRSKLTESPEFTAISKKNKLRNRIPLLNGIRTYPIEMISTTLLVGANGVNFYFIAVFLLDYIKIHNQVDIGYVSLLTTIVPAILAPIMGIISDRWHRGKMLLLGIALLGCYNIIALPMLFTAHDTFTVGILLLGYAALFSIQSGTINTYSVEIFPTECRFSCGALSYALGMALIGGTSPMVAAYLTRDGENIDNVVIYVLILTAIAFSAGIFSIFKHKIFKR